MRRRSLVGPLLLVLIGALFLIGNLRPGWISLSTAVRYWPFLKGNLRQVELWESRFLASKS